MAYKRNLAFPLAPTVSDPGDKKKKKKKKTKRSIDREDKRIRGSKISKQLAVDGFYSVDVSGERKVKKKVAKIQDKIDAVTDKKDARQKKLVKSGLRRETRKNQLLQKQVEAKRVESGEKGKFGKRIRKPKNEDRDRGKSDDGRNKVKKNKGPKKFKGKASKNAINTGGGGGCKFKPKGKTKKRPANSCNQYKKG